MTHHFKLHTLTAFSLACAVLAGCGGGDAEAPPPPAAASPPLDVVPGPDTTPPTLTQIANDVSAPTATGPVTFTFLFSEDVGTSFGADDIVVIGGTKGAFARTTSGAQATLVVVPIANSTGTIDVSVAAGRFSDLAGNANTVGASAQKAYSSVVKTQMALPVNFDSATVDYGFIGFGGAEASSLAADPANAANSAAKVVRAAGAETYAGTTITAAAGLGFTPKIPFNANDTRMSVRVWSPDAGIPVRLKVEDHADGNKSVETETTTTTANAWQTLTFNFATQATGTAPLNLAFNYDKATIFFDFGRAKASAVQKTYYFDDVTFVPGTGGGGGGAGSGSTGTCTAATCITFSGSAITFSPFENQGGGTVELANDPNDAGNRVAKFVKKAGDSDYFGTVVNGVGTVVLAPNAKTVTMRVLSPAAGKNILLKFEGGAAGAAPTELDVVTTKANQWETLTFVMPGTGSFSTVVIFPNGRSQVTADTTIYIDELNFPAAAGGGGGGGGAACTAPNCVDFSAAGIVFAPFENPAGGTVAIDNDPTNAANKVVKFVKKAGDADYFGTTIGGLGVSVVLTGASKTVTMRVYSPAVGTNFLLKFEGGTGGPAVTEKDAVTTTANAWETLSFVMPDAGTYSTIVVFPHGRSGVSADTTMYIDDLTFPATVATGGGGGGGGGGVFAGGIFSSDYTGSLADGSAKSTLGGSVGFFYDLRLFATKVFSDGAVTGSAADPNGVHNFWYGFGKAPTPIYTDAYFGGFVNAPSNATADASAFAKIKLKFWGDAETWEKTNFTPQVEVVLQGPTNAACTNGSGRPELTRTVAGQKNGAGAEYIILKTEFTLKANCGGTYTVNSVWAAVGAVVVQLNGTNLQYINPVVSGTGTAYPTFINIGPIAFVN